MKRFLKISTTALALSVAFIGQAQAGGTVAETETTTVKIDTGRGGAVRQSLSLGYGKSAIIELPMDVRDVLVSNPNSVDAVVRTSRQVYLLGMVGGTSTDVIFFDAAGRQILSLDVSVGLDTAQLQDLMKQHIPNADIQVENVRGSFVLSGTVATAAESARAVQLATMYLKSHAPMTGSASGGSLTVEVLNFIQVAQSQQVMLKVRIVEMQRSLIKQLGVNISAAGLSSGGTSAWGLIQNNGGLLLDDETDTINYLFPTNSTNLSYSSNTGNTSVDAMLKAMENLGIVRTLAEPNLTAISGEPAKFLAGGEIPVNATIDQNGNAVVNYKPYGVGLGFTPVVMSKGRISLKLSTEVSDIGSGGTAANPAFNVRRAETTVEMPSGASLVIAGILQSRARNTAMGTPGVKDIPILGALFRSRDFLQEETELVIIVTPYLVNPVAPSKIQTPADGMQFADDGESLLMGRTNKVTTGSSK